VTFTDGMENQSTEYTQAQVFGLISSARNSVGPSPTWGQPGLVRRGRQDRLRRRQYPELRPDGLVPPPPLPAWRRR